MGDPPAIFVATAADGSEATGLARTSTAVVFEAAWFLERHLAWSRARCADQLRSILGARGVVVLDQVLLAAVELFATNRRLNFVDAYVGACSLVLGPATVVSFDRDFDRIDGIARIGS